MTETKLPAGACDAHVHVFRPDTYPYAADRAYTPGRKTAAELSNFLTVHGLRRVVIVQPSVYGIDNRAMVDALAELGRRRARGIAVVDVGHVKDEALADLAAAGVVGIRLNMATSERGDLGKSLRAADKRLAGSDWHIQIYAPLAAVIAAARTIGRLSRPVVLDHFSGIQMSDSRLEKGQRALISLVQDGPVYIKLSGAYRACGDARRRWSAVQPIATALSEKAPDRLVWGSDWPHTGAHGQRGAGAKARVEPFQKIDDRVAIKALAKWAGSARMLRRILVDTPRELYGFK